MDPLNPYRIESSDSPMMTLVTDTLTTENYVCWSRNVKRALRAKNKLGFITGQIPKPSSVVDPAYDLWERCNDMVISWLLNSISPSIKASLMFVDNARELWDELHSRLSQHNATRIFQLRKELASLKQGADTVMIYYGKLKSIWDELLVYDEQPKCTCGQLRILGERYQRDCVMQFLMGLNDVYSPARDQILMMDPVPSVNRVFGMIQQQEKQHFVADGNPEGDLMAMALQKVKVNQKQAARKDKPFCSHCKISGHSLSRCFKAGNAQPMKCTHCNMNGHTVDKCYKLKGFPPGHKFYHKTTTDNIIASNVSAQVPEDSREDKCPFTKGQIQELFQWFNSEKTRERLKEPQGDKPREPTHCLNVSGKYSNLEHDFENINKKENCLWVLDTGATNHMTCDKSLFSDDWIPCMYRVTLPNGQTVNATAIGSVRLSKDILLKNVLFLPSFHFNLVSVRKLMIDINCRVVFMTDTCFIQDQVSWKTLGEGKVRKGLYCFHQKPNHNNDCPRNTTCSMAAQTTNSFTLWHHRLGHPSNDKLIQMHKTQNFPSFSGCKSNPCTTCHFAKQHRLPFQDSSHCTSKPFELVHCDLWGPYSEASHHGSRYFLTIVDDFSRCTWVYILKYKTEVPSIFENFYKMILNQFCCNIKMIRTDHGTEFNLNLFCQQNGIIHQKSCVQTPQQNGVVERKHQHLLNVARALKFQSHLPIEYWSECILTAAYIINRLPTPVLNNKTPFEILFQTKPSYDHMKVFGCLCFCATLKEGRNKFDPRAKRCIFLGYPFGIKGYKLLELETNQIIVSRNVIFYEDIFPYEEINKNLDSNNTASFKGYENTLPTSETIREDEITLFPTPENHNESNLSPAKAESNDKQGELTSETSLEEISPEPKRSTRKKNLPKYLNDYYCQQVSGSNSGNKIIQEPNNYNDASQVSEWCEAMNEELKALEENKTWTITDLPLGKKAIGCKYVYKIKYKSDGSIDRFKARLVAKGYTQEYGLDYQETFSPVAKITTVRIILAIAVKMNWYLEQLDVNNAFLHGNLEEDIYMIKPPGYNKGRKHQVCKLNKSIYGLKQASRQWNQTFCAAVKNFGFDQSKADYSLFTMNKSNSFTAIVVYVDDIIVTGNNSTVIKKLKTYLNDVFKIKDIGNLSYFLGIELIKTQEGIHLSQRNYILDILADCEMTNCKTSKVPMEQNIKLSKYDGEPIPDPSVYRRLIGRLLYLTITRPDIAFPVHTLSQFMEAPTDIHLKAAYKVLRYLKLTMGQGIHLFADSDFQLTGFCDADWGSCPDTRRSVTGYCVMFGKSLISWRSKKQSLVSKSSAEAEYRSIATLCTELIWIKFVLEALQVHHNDPVKVYCDSQAALHIASNPVFHERTKHIELDCHLVRDLVQAKRIETKHVGSQSQVADIFTKSLPAGVMKNHLDKMGVINLSPPS